MAFGVSDMIGLICSHPVAFISVLLFFTPPLFPVVVYFSPLLISTALVVLAMVSMGSYVESPRPAVERKVQYHYATGWIEEVSEVASEAEEEREPKRVKAASPRGDRWLSRMKSLKGTGRAWMESVLSQESDGNSGGDQSVVKKKDSRPFLSAAKELFSHENNKHGRGAEQKSQRLGVHQDAPDSFHKSALSDITPYASAIGDSAEEDKNVKSTEATSQVEPGVGNKANSLRSGASLLFRSRSASRREAGSSLFSRDFKNDVPLRMARSFSAREKGKEKDLAIQPVTENNAPLPLGKKDKPESSNKVDMDGGAEVQTLEIVPVENQNAPKIPSLDHEKCQKSEPHSSLEDKGEKSVSPDFIATGAAAAGDDVVSDIPYHTGSVQSASSKPSKLATESLEQGNAKGCSVDSPSAAVALSEKLKVPLADIMSLLTGDEPDDAKLESGPGLKGPTSSESTSSQEDEWSTSDGESIAAPPAVKADGEERAPSEKK